jgi:radical SAM protein with 4Fe4S-binding SPASM domain
MCPRESHTRLHGIMDQTLYERSIDEVVGLGAEQVVLTGFGEPMLDRRLENKIRYAKSKGLRTYIISNGSALTPRRAAGLLLAGLDELRVSYYGMRAETYGAVMRGLDFERTTKNLLHFLTVRKSLNLQCKIQLSYLVLPENEMDVDAFRAFWEPKVDYIEIWKPHNFGDGKDFRQRIGIKKTCGRPANGPLQIQWDGTVIPCCYDYNNQIQLGNAFEDDVPTILKGNKYQALRDAHSKGEFHKFPYCDQCDQLLEHSDALVYTNRHNLPAAEAVKLSNTDLYNLSDALKFKEI